MIRSCGTKPSKVVLSRRTPRVFRLEECVLCEYVRRPVYVSRRERVDRCPFSVSKKVSRENDLSPPKNKIKTYEFIGQCRLRFCGRRVSLHRAGTRWWRAGSAEIPNGRTSATPNQSSRGLPARETRLRTAYFMEISFPLSHLPPTHHTQIVRPMYFTRRTCVSRPIFFFLFRLPSK